MEVAYRENDELTSTDIKRLLVPKLPDVSVSISTIKLTCKETKWVFSLGRYVTQPHVETT